MARELFHRPSPEEVSITTRKLVAVAISTVLAGLTLGRDDPTPIGRALRLAARKGALAAIARLLPPANKRPVGRPPKVRLNPFGKAAILMRMAELTSGATESLFEHGEEPTGYVANARPSMGIAKAADVVVADFNEQRKAWLKSRREARAMSGTPPAGLTRGKWRASFEKVSPPVVPTKNAIIAMWRTSRRQRET